MYSQIKNSRFLVTNESTHTNIKHKLMDGMDNPKYPILFLCHGGGPLPLIGKQPELIATWRDHATQFFSQQPPKAILIISAHYQTDQVHVCTNLKPHMIYDYTGFPPETYKFQYPANGCPAVAHKAAELIKAAGISCVEDASYGYDHGVFVPIEDYVP